MEDRTELKEKRNSYLWLFWIIFTVVVSISLEFIFGFKTSIYKLTNYGYYFTISKYSVEYTNLDLEWSIPFSTLFQEQEYILEGSYNFTLDDGGWKVEDVTNLEIPYKIKDEQSRQVEELINSAKTLEQQKIDNLNKVFNENYK